VRTFMLGWEFPPYISGGLGTACYGLTKAMDRLGIGITFVLPKVDPTQHSSHVKVFSAQGSMMVGGTRAFKNVCFRTVASPLRPYLTSGTYEHQSAECGRREDKKGRRVRSWRWGGSDPWENYGGDMYEEVQRYACQAAEIATIEEFDVVHAHDWMTYPAGIAVAKASGKPLIVHVHSTEFDRSGEHVNQMIYDIERMGMHAALRVIAVSYFTRGIIISRYGVNSEKVEVVHNGVERSDNDHWFLADTGIKRNERIVLFLGRITMQKGPEYFLQAAKKVLEVVDDVKFVMVGSGDLMHRAVEMAAELGIGHKVLFTGFLRGDDVQKIYKMADLFVMPSVSEPFGIVPLEALNNNVPVIISKQSGVSEVLKHALKVDFWDVNEIANKIVAVLKYPPLEMTLRNYGNFEVRKLNWKESAEKCARIYEELLVAV